MRALPAHPAKLNLIMKKLCKALARYSFPYKLGLDSI
jgi:hypothetical protein